MGSRVVFLHNCIGNINSGVNKKVLSQVSAMKGIGMDVQLAVFCSSEDKLEECRMALAKHCSDNMDDITLWTKGYYSMRDISRLLDSLRPTDFLYVRYPPIPRITMPLLLANGGPRVVFEVNGILSKEGGSEAAVGPIWRLFERGFGRVILRKGAGIVAVTDEIVRYYGRGKGPMARSVVIPNGIDVGRVPVRSYRGAADGTVRLIGVAFVSNWHGFDRVIRGISRYHGDRDMVFHIVGEGPEINQLKALTSSMGLSEKVRFHGFLTGEPLDALFDMCDIAVGTLALHRKGLSEACTLKAREYCARGIPFIDSGKDPDFPDDFEHIMRMPLDDSVVSIPSILEFADRARGSPSHQEAMTQYARKQLDWSTKEQELRSFLETLSDRHPNDDRAEERLDQAAPLTCRPRSSR